MTRSLHNKLENIFELFENVGATTSLTEKQRLLSDYYDREFLSDILFYTYNPYYIYGIAKRGTNEVTNIGESVREFEGLFELLDYLKDNNGGSNECRGILEKFALSFDDKFMYDYIYRIVFKDLKMGVAIGTINKVFHKLIPTFDVSLCKTYEGASSLRYDNYIVQPKLDGVRVIVHCSVDSVSILTRNGMTVSGYEEIESALSHIVFDGLTLDGEILSSNFDETMEGLFAHKGNKKAVLHVFDMMSTKEFKSKTCYRKYSERYENYIDKCNQLMYPVIIPVLGAEYTKKELTESIELLDILARDKGYEGLVVKGAESTYDFKRSYAWIKYKNMHTEEFTVTGVKGGTGKYDGMLGALTVDVNGVSVDVGSGFTDEQRDWLWNSCDPVGALVEIKYQEKTKDGSLRFPVFIKFRNDL